MSPSQTITGAKLLSRYLTADTRRLTPTKMFSPQRRPSTGLGTLSLSKGRGRRELIFCLSGDDDKQKHVSIADDNRIKTLKWRLNCNFWQINAKDGSRRDANHANTIKTVRLQKARCFAQSSSPDWAKILTSAYSAPLR